MSTAATTYSLAPSYRSAPRQAAPGFRAALPRFRPTWPEMPRTGGTGAALAGVALRATLAAVPFAGLGWLFVTR